MGNKKYVSEYMLCSRLNSHGKIESLAEPFKLEYEQPFSIFLMPKGATATAFFGEVMDVRLYKDDVVSPCPVTIGAWQELQVVEVAATAAPLLEKYDIYWAAGTSANKETKQTI